MRFFGLRRAGKDADSTIRKGESSARSRIQRILAVLLALNGSLLFLVFRPLDRSPAERQAELQRSRVQYEGALNTVKQMRDLRARVQAAIQNDQQFSREHFLPRKTAFSAMLTDLERLASQNRLKTSSVSYRLKEDPKQPGFVNVEVTMTIDGQYSDLVQFINRLEQSQLFWIIDSLNVSPSANRGLRLNLEMGTYAVSS